MSFESFVYLQMQAPLPYLFGAAGLTFLAAVTLLYVQSRATRNLVLLVMAWTSAILFIALEILMDSTLFNEWHNYSLAIRFLDSLQLYFMLATVLALCACLPWKGRAYDA
jgi:hypothetical protein